MLDWCVEHSVKTHLNYTSAIDSFYFFKSLGGKAEKAINIIINYPYLPVTWSKYLVPVVGDVCLLWFKQPEEQSNIEVKKVNESESRG